jgi:uncharacterized protein (DUF305 family)
MADIVVAKPDVDIRVASGMSMGGMMSQSDMDALSNASGAEASKLFFLQMTEHPRVPSTCATRNSPRDRAPRC